VDLKAGSWLYADQSLSRAMPAYDFSESDCKDAGLGDGTGLVEVVEEAVEIVWVRGLDW
jgi:hypothetical protein